MVSVNLTTRLADLPAPIVFTDGQGRFEAANAAALALLRRVDEGSAGEGWEILRRGIMARSDVLARPLHGPREQVHVSALDGGRRLIWFDLGIRYLPDGRRMMILDDVTEQVALEGRTERSEAADRLGRLAGGIAHLLNNHLQIVSGHAARLSRRPELAASAELARSVAQIVSAAGEAQAAVSRVSELARAGRRRSPRRLSLAQLVMTAAAEREPALPVSDRLAGRTSEVEADAAAIATILMCLIDNAIEATGAGHAVSLTLEERLLDEGQYGLPGGPWLAVAVHDQGAGLRPDVAAEMFEPFFTTKAHGTGAGLGLTIAERLAVGEGGFIDVQTTPGRGSAFCLLLPRARRRSGESSGAEVEASRP